MKRLIVPSILACLGLFVAGSLAPARAANILILTGTDPYPSIGPSGTYSQTTAAVLQTDLSGSNTVTVVTGSVPASLTGYTQIYDVRFYNTPAFTAGEMTQYLAFLNASPNNTIFMMGENPNCCGPRDVAINQFIAFAGGGTIAVPAATSEALETVATQFRVPNPITTVSFAACGLVTTAGNGAFASSESGGGCSLFFGRGALQNALQGALVVVYDVNFIATAPDSGYVNEIAFRQNLEQFVSAPVVAPGATAVPALTVWGQILLALGLCVAAAIVIRRRVRAPASANSDL